MALTAKQNKPANHYEKLIKELFKKHFIPFNRPEYEELLLQGANASQFGRMLRMDSHFEGEVINLRVRSSRLVFSPHQRLV